MKHRSSSAFIGTMVAIMFIAGGCNSSGHISRDGVTLTDLQPMSKAEAVEYLRTTCFRLNESIAPVAVKAKIDSLQQNQPTRPAFFSLMSSYNGEVDETHLKAHVERLNRDYIFDANAGHYRWNQPYTTVEESDIKFGDVIVINIGYIYDTMDSYIVSVSCAGEKQYNFPIAEDAFSGREAHKVASAFAALCPQIQEFIKKAK